MKRLKLIGALLILFIYSCSEDTEEQLTSDAVSDIRVIDLGDSDDANDFVVLFKISNPAIVESLKLFISPASTYNQMKNEFEPESIQMMFYQPVQISGSNYEVYIDPSLLDVNADVVQNGIEYNVGFIVGVDGTERLNDQVGSIIPSDKHILEGDFVGTWNDNIYTDFGISASIKFISNNRFSGTFWYSANFTSCCMGDDDGTIIFRIDGGQVVDFQYDQFLAQFLGGECPGFYQGEGRLENFSTLAIDFAGEDCEGPHTGGRIKLSKVR